MDLLPVLQMNIWPNARDVCTYRIFDQLRFRRVCAYAREPSIGVVPITQVTHVRYKNSNIQGRSLNVIKIMGYSLK